MRNVEKVKFNGSNVKLKNSLRLSFAGTQPEKLTGLQGLTFCRTGDKEITKGPTEKRDAEAGNGCISWKPGRLDLVSRSII